MSKLMIAEKALTDERLEYSALTAAVPLPDMIVALYGEKNALPDIALVVSQGVDSFANDKVPGTYAYLLNWVDHTFARHG